MWFLVATGVTLCLCTNARSNCPVGDLDADCEVGLSDLRVLAEYWLTDAVWPINLNSDLRVDFVDFSILADQWRRRHMPLLINEFMASNSSVEKDPQGQYDDWIEIYNFGDVAIDMAGMYVTDSLDEPRKWCVPSDDPEATTVPAGRFLIIWADGDVNDAGLHAAFRLDADSDQLALFDTDGTTLLDSIEFGQQRPDISYGRLPDGNDTWTSMAFATPGHSNIDIYEGFVSDVQFSHDRGFYDEPFDVTLATETEDALIFYTTDGSEPYDRSGRGSIGHLYDGPIEITTTTCLRAKAIRRHWRPSQPVSQTYIFADHVRSQSDAPPGFPATWGQRTADYEMDPEIAHHPKYRDILADALLTHRTISLAMNQADLFDPITGIYSNSRNKGVAWERPVSVEVVDPCDGRETHINAGIRIQGSASRNPNRPKHNLRLLFKGIYGATKLNFPLIEGWPVEQFDSIILRGGNGDSWFHPNVSQQIRAQYIRDQWPRDIQVAMGHLTAGQCYAHLYINGLYWGLYHIIERPNAAFFAEHLGGREDQYDVIKHKNGTVDGNRVAWNAMMEIANQGLASNERYEQLQQYMDLHNLIDFMLLNFYSGNTDWDHNNWYGGRRRSPGAGFHFFAWDSERTYLSLTHDVTGKNNANQPTHVHQQLAANANYRMLFADHMYRRFFDDGVLTPENAKAHWLARAEEIRLALVAESALWDDNKRTDSPYTPDLK